MKGWFRRSSENNLPEYWENYISQFSEELPVWAHDTPFVVLDTETTGLDLQKDRILSIGAVTVFRGNIEVRNTFERYTRQEHFNPESAVIHGLVQHPKTDTVSEEEMLKDLLDYVKNAPIVAHHAYFDIGMINAALKRLGLPGLENKVMDTMRFYQKSLITSNVVDKSRSFSLDEVAQKLQVPLNDRHTATGDAFITALVFLKLWGRWTKNEPIKTRKLLRIQ